MGPSCGHLGAILDHLGYLGAVLGHFGAISGSYHVHLAPFQVYDFGRWMVHRRLCKIRTSLTREHHFEVALIASWDHLGSILGPSWGHLPASWRPLGLSRGHPGVILPHAWGHLVSDCTPTRKLQFSHLLYELLYISKLLST